MEDSQILPFSPHYSECSKALVCVRSDKQNVLGTSWETKSFFVPSKSSADTYARKNFPQIKCFWNKSKSNWNKLHSMTVTPEIFSEQATNTQSIWHRWQHLYNLHSAITKFSQELVYLLQLLMIKEENFGGQLRTRKILYEPSFLFSTLQGEAGKPL